MIGLLSLVVTFIIVYFYTKKTGMPQLVPWGENLLKEQETDTSRFIEDSTWSVNKRLLVL
jgi:hypothetical protein